MDRASHILAEGSPGSYAARAAQTHGEVNKSTLHARDHGRPSRKEKDQRQQYLTPSEEKAVVKFLLHMSKLGKPVPVKYIPSLALSIAIKRSTNRRTKPPHRNWASAFEKRHPELTARRVRALDWDRHPNNIYDKIVEWFEIIGDVVQAPDGRADVRPENWYNNGRNGSHAS